MKIFDFIKRSRLPNNVDSILFHEKVKDITEGFAEEVKNSPEIDGVYIIITKQGLNGRSLLVSYEGGYLESSKWDLVTALEFCKDDAKEKAKRGL